ncbi:YkyA family protein [Atopobacter phocae]|uniref:YkyA family protein n=1 Tax=Atopobacter phocae TaxID=136492 RepID=UPI0004707B2B|nr:YkyA family protein [Atopobacter phocae]
MKHITKVFICISFICFLSGCGSRESQAISSLEKFEQTTHDMEYSFNQIKAKEVNLQSDWEQTIADSDEEMNLFEKQEGPVFENIKDRSDQLKNIHVPHKLLLKAIKKLKAIESDQTKGASKADVSALIFQLKDLEEKIATFDEAYEKQLVKEQHFFAHLANQDIKFKEFNKELNQLNKEAHQTKEQLLAIESSLRDLQNPIRQLHDGLVNP